MSVRQIVLTYEDYCELPDDGKRYEIHQGELVVNPAPTPGHQRVLRRLNRLLEQHIETNRLGELFFAPLDCILDDTSVVQPDLVFIANDRGGQISGRGIEGAPTLVVEIVSPSSTRTDRGRKMQLYAKFGVPYYWIVDPGVQRLEAFELISGSYELVADGTMTQTVRLAPFSELAIPLAEIWN
ncbi:MAG: Uma2 family endonuclease [Chloroflexota bacterium]